jgi:hypothetical protein
MRLALQVAAFVFCAILTCTVSEAQTLDGSTVTATLDFPDLSTVYGGPTSATVGASTPTFPVGSIAGESSFQINVTSNQIVYDPFYDGTYGTETFNGFVFDFSGAPNIVGVTLDGASTFTPTAISFTSDSVSLNLSGNTVTATDTAILDLQLQNVTPEPSTAILWFTGIGLMIVMRKRLAHLLRLDAGTGARSSS